MREKLLNAYRKYFNKFKACDEVGLPVQEWNRLLAEDPEFSDEINKIHEEKAEAIKAELITKENKSTAEIKLALELLLLNNSPLKKVNNKPGKHSKSQSGEQKRAWIEERKKQIADDE